MDLSEIPEPSENTIACMNNHMEALKRFAEKWPKSAYMIDNFDWTTLRMIHAGRVLASLTRGLLSQPHDRMPEEARAAISFFEKFGGDDER